MYRCICIYIDLYTLHLPEPYLTLVVCCLN